MCVGQAGIPDNPTEQTGRAEVQEHRSNPFRQTDRLTDSCQPTRGHPVACTPPVAAGPIGRGGQSTYRSQCVPVSPAWPTQIRPPRLSGQAVRSPGRRPDAIRTVPPHKAGLLFSPTGLQSGRNGADWNLLDVSACVCVCVCIFRKPSGFPGFFRSCKQWLVQSK